MLYVFHVDVGRMLTFDMTVALSSVQNLKDTIDRLHGIPAINIVLLVSGGEVLTASTQVSYYSAGTDTNPIYMFLKGDYNAKIPAASSQTELDLEIREQVERSLDLPAVYETVVTRAQLALRLQDLARDEERYCERLVHEQHLQQQGWFAVVANMEDLTVEFSQRFRNFCMVFDRHFEKRPGYLQLLKHFGDDLKQLSEIPILPGLMPLAEQDFHGFDEFLDTDEVFSRSHLQQESVIMAQKETTTAAGTECNVNENQEAAGGETVLSTESKNSTSTSSTSPNKKLKMGNETSTTTRRLNLLQWITTRENHNALQLMSEECIQGLSAFNEEIYEKLKSEVQSIIKVAEQQDVKEIKGLGERLCKLDEFKYKIQTTVQEQKEHSTSFQHNQNRAINLKDASILPDLCASHKSQLMVMQQNHQKITEYRHIIAKAKAELGNNLNTRLKRIDWIENAMSKVDNHLLFYHRCLRRAERHIMIIDQIHQAPCIYVAAITEVVRRKIFSGEFSKWASKLAEDFEGIHSEEIKRRQTFNANFEGHFLNNLFPGMSDMPPAFANENPLIFDARLPNLTYSDMDMLSSCLPKLASQVQLPDMGPVINFFVSRSGEHQKERLEELLKQQAAEVYGKSPQHQRLKALMAPGIVGCDESETDDTETEFEQVAQQEQTISVGTSMSEVHCYMARSTLTDRQLLMRSAETLTDENEESAREEVQRLRGYLSAMSKLSIECLRLARENMKSFRSDAVTYQEDLQSELQTINEKWRVMCMQSEQRDQEMFHLNESRDQEIKRLQSMLEERDKQLSELQEQLQTNSSNEQQQLNELREQLKNTQMQHESELASLREQLTHEHKTEIESLRCRYKLMTSMELSPSETSLEKIERPSSRTEQNVIDLAQHELALAQLRTSLEAERERAISAALEAERSIWQLKIVPLNSESVMANVGMLKEMLAEKERQLDLFREKDLMVTKENYQLKSRLDALTNEEASSWLKEKIEYLNRDKTRLEEELNMEKSRRLEMETSVAAIKSSTYDQGSSSTLIRSKSVMSSHKYIVLESCSKGDIVFVVWSMRHCQFMVVQDSQSLYFVHGDSLLALNLQLPTSNTDYAENLSIPMPYYAIGRVIEKEYCQAKKDENRYRVTRGSKFYRIKLAPLIPKLITRRERLESFSNSISRSISQCESHSESSALVPSSAVAIPVVNTGSSTSLLQQTLASAAKDLVDSSSVLMATSPTFGSNFGMNIKERTISVTSVAEVEEEADTMDDRSCYMSADEETQNMDSTSSTLDLQEEQAESQQRQAAAAAVEVTITAESDSKKE